MTRKKNSKSGECDGFVANLGILPALEGHHTAPVAERFLNTDWVFREMGAAGRVYIPVRPLHLSVENPLRRARGSGHSCRSWRAASIYPNSIPSNGRR
jgi:hypothetical protein